MKKLLFCVIAIVCSIKILSAQNSLQITRAEIYNFGIGDVFEYTRTNSGLTEKIRKTITAKSLYTDSVCYTVNYHTLRQCNACLPGNLNYEHVYSTSEDCYGHLSDTLKTTTYCNIFPSGQLNQNCTGCKSFIENDGCFGDTEGDSTSSNSFFGKDIYYQFSFFSTPLSGEEGTEYTYAKELGLVKSNWKDYHDGQNSFDKTDLEFAKKGSSTFGTPLNFSLDVITINTNDLKYQVDENQVTFSSTLEMIYLYNINGQLLQKFYNVNRIDLNELSNSCYYLLIQSKQQIHRISIIKYE